MEKRLSVVIYKHGQHNDSILRMIASHNSNTAEVSLKDIAGYVKARRAEFPGLFGQSGSIFTEDNTCLTITEDLETFTLKIEELEVFALSEVNVSDVNK